MEKSNVEKVKDYATKVLEESLKYDKTIEDRARSRSRAFGGIDFAIQVGFVTYEEINDWWECEMHPKFTSPILREILKNL